MEAPTSYDAVGAAQNGSQLAIEWENTVEEIFVRNTRSLKTAAGTCDGGYADALAVLA
jgi:hypothetical protein